MGRIRAQAIEETDQAKIVSVYDNNPKACFDGYVSSNTPNEIISNTKIDAVFICTPNYLNMPLTIQALKAGKHVFCEKPPAFNSKEMQEIIIVEKMSCKKLMYGFNHRHHSSIVQMKNIIDSGEYGKILWMRGRYGKSVDQNFFKTWRSKRETAGGGILLDQGIHMLDLFIMFGGGFDTVKADVSSLYWEQEIEDNVFAIYKNINTGVVASLHSTMTQWRHLFSLELFLERGYMVLNGLNTSSGTYGDEILSIAKNRTTAPAATWEDEEHITFHANSSWQSEISHFFEYIATDSKVKIGKSQEALELMILIDLTYKEGTHING